MNKSFILNNGKYIKFTSKTYSHVLIEPKMTAITSNGYSVTGTQSSTGSDLWKAFDGDASTYYRNYRIADPVSIILELPIKKVISQYSIAPLTENSTPKSWKLYGSNDSLNWNLINSASASSFEDSKRLISTNNNDPYKFYKLDILEGTSYFYISEIKYYEKIEIGEDTSTVISDALPTVSQFILDGMSDLSVLDRKSKIQPIAMNDDSNNGIGETLENGKMFKERIDLNKYFDLINLNIK